MKKLTPFIAIALFSISAFTQDNPSKLILNGSTDGYQIENFDDKFDFGLIIPALKKDQILDFNLSSLISTKKDTLRTAGRTIKIPSNISLPKQRERYYIILKIKKPNFSLPIHLNEPPETLVLLEGSLPVTKTIETLRNGDPFFSIINSFKIKSFSLTPLIDLESNLKLTVGEHLIDDDSIAFNVPFEIDKDFISIGLNLNSTLNKTGTPIYFPVNIKTLEKPQNLATGRNNTPVIAIIPKSAFKKTSTEKTVKTPFPFSLVWGESKPITMLPLAKDFVTFKKTDVEQGIFVDNSKLLDFKVLAYNVKTFNTNGEILTEDTLKTMQDLTWPLDVPISRIRLDVFALDPDPIMESIKNSYLFDEDFFKQVKYITRYEKNIN